jgi:Mrp family chromosome partitioning ATPase/capsular polysaccharide biosynthesis protein
MPTGDEPLRDLRSYLAIFRRRFWLSAVVALVTVGAAAAFTFTQPVLYRSKMKLFVGTEGGLLPPNVVNAANQFTQTMSDLLLSEIVAQRAIQRAQLDIRPQQLLDRLHVTTKPDTSVLLLSYDDTDSGRGTRTLAAVGDAFTRLVVERLTRTGDQELAVSVSVFNEAHPTGQVQPKPIRNLAVAIVLGALLGVIAAFVREQLDDTIRTVDQAEQAFGQAATITLAPGIVGYRPLDRSQAKRIDPILTELAFQRLRASILWSPESREARTLLVTSANPEEGKTTVAANLAVLMVTEGRDVIVVEGDLRHPTLHRYLGMPPPMDAVGLDEILRGEAAAAEALIEIPVPALTFTAVPRRRIGGSWIGHQAGPPAQGRLRAILTTLGSSQPSEVGLARTAEVLSELRSQAEFVIFDAPPILVVPDAYPFAVSVDTVIAVVRNGKATAKATAALSRSLERLGPRRVELVVTEAEAAFAQTYYYGRRSAGRPRERRAAPGQVPPARRARIASPAFGQQASDQPTSASRGEGVGPAGGGAER